MTFGEIIHHACIAILAFGLVQLALNSCLSEVAWLLLGVLFILVLTKIEII